MKYYNTEAVILKNINYGDSNKIYTLYTKDLGKITAIARGVRKLQSRRAGNLDTLNYVKVKISEDSKGFKSIQEVSTVNSFKGVKDDLKSALKALYIIELLNKFLEPEHSHVEIFYVLLNSLKKLADKSYVPELVVNNFEISFMNLLGFRMNLDKCSKCLRLFDTSWKNVKFNYSLGGFLCDRCSDAGLPLDIDTAVLLNKLERNIIDKYPAENEKKEMVNADKIIKNYMTNIFEELFRFSKTYRLIKETSL